MILEIMGLLSCDDVGIMHMVRSSAVGLPLRSLSLSARLCCFLGLNMASYILYNAWSSLFRGIQGFWLKDVGGKAASLSSLGLRVHRSKVVMV